MKFWTTAPEAYDYSYTVDTDVRKISRTSAYTDVRSGLKMGLIYRLVEITDPNRVQYQRERYLSGLHPAIPFESLLQELP